MLMLGLLQLAAPRPQGPVSLVPPACDDAAQPAAIYSGSMGSCPGSHTAAQARPGGVPLQVLFTLSHWTAPTAELWARNQRNFPDFCFKSYTDSEMACSVQHIDQLLEAENVTGAYDAFRRLRPGAFRADLWRYMILWAEGGLYLDAKFEMLVDPRKWMDFDDGKLVLVQAEPCPVFYNAIMAASPRDPQLLDVIRLVLRRDRSRFRMSSDARCAATHQPIGMPYLWVTGPGALADALMTRHGVWKDWAWAQPIGEQQPRVTLDIAPKKMLAEMARRLAEEKKAWCSKTFDLPSTALPP